MRYPTCPKHMLLKPCMHCEPSVGPPVTGKKTRRKATTLRDGDRLYRVWDKKEFVGTVVGELREHAVYDGWFKITIKKPDGTLFEDIVTPSEEYDVES